MKSCRCGVLSRTSGMYGYFAISSLCNESLNPYQAPTSRLMKKFSWDMLVTIVVGAFPMAAMVLAKLCMIVKFRDNRRSVPNGCVNVSNFISSPAKRNANSFDIPALMLSVRGAPVLSFRFSSSSSLSYQNDFVKCVLSGVSPTASSSMFPQCKSLDTLHQLQHRF